jgi:hypothetical protein
MNRLTLLPALIVFAMLTAPSAAEAQGRRHQQGAVAPANVLILRVRPRTFLDPGTVVPVGSLDRTASGFAQTQSYLANPPWGSRDRFGQGSLPDPITNGPFVGSRNPFGPVDFVAPPGVAR